MINIPAVGVEGEGGGATIVTAGLAGSSFRTPDLPPKPAV
jgi:hypothetical protein